MPAERAPERARARARARAPAAAGRATGADSRAHGVGPGSRARACGRRLALPRGGRGRGLAHQRQRGVRVRGLARQRDGRATGAGSRAHGVGPGSRARAWRQRQRGVRVRGLARQRNGRATGARRARAREPTERARSPVRHAWALSLSRARARWASRSTTHLLRSRRPRAR
jgi:hypothetical protein